MRIVLIMMISAGLAVAGPVYQANYRGLYVGLGINNSNQIVGSTYAGLSSPVRITGGSTEILPGTGEAAAINSDGVAAGQISVPGGYSAVYGGSPWTQIAVPGSTQGYASAINDAGNVVVNADGSAYVWNGTTLVNIGNLGVSAEGRGINSAGHVTGTSVLADHETVRAFVWDGTTMNSLGTLAGGTGTWAYAINDSGQVAGVGDSTTGYQAFLYSGGTMTGLGTIGGVGHSNAWALNESGEVVGYSYDEFSVARAFVYTGGVMYDLNTVLTNDLPEGVRLFDARGINDSGAIVANAVDAGGSVYGVYLLTPVNSQATPEPSTALLLAGAGAVVAAAVRRRR